MVYENIERVWRWTRSEEGQGQGYRTTFSLFTIIRTVRFYNYVLTFAQHMTVKDTKLNLIVTLKCFSKILKLYFLELTFCIWVEEHLSLCFCMCTHKIKHDVQNATLIFTVKGQCQGTMHLLHVTSQIIGHRKLSKWNATKIMSFENVTILHDLQLI